MNLKIKNKNCKRNIKYYKYRVIKNEKKEMFRSFSLNENY